MLNAKTGEPIPDASAAAFKKVRVNNALRRAIEGATGSLTLANPDPRKAPRRRRRRRSRRATPRRCRRFEAQLAKESDPRVADALQARARGDRRDERQRARRRTGSPRSKP